MVMWTEHASPVAKRHLAHSMGGGPSASFDNASRRLLSTVRVGRRHTVDVSKAFRWGLLLASCAVITTASVCFMLSREDMPGRPHDVYGRRHESAVADDVIGRREEGVGKASSMMLNARNRRDKLVSGRVSCPTSSVGMEPSGFVFDGPHNDRKERGYLNVSRLLATAGPHICVFDNPGDLKEAIRSCRNKAFCSSDDIMELLRDGVTRLVQEETSAASDFSCYAHNWEESHTSMIIQADARSEVAPSPVVLGIPSASGEQDVCMGEWETGESDCDDLDFSEWLEAVEERDRVEARQA